MKKLSIFLVWIAMIGGLIYWSSNIEGTVNAGQVDASTVITRSYSSSSGNNSQYYTFAYTDAETGKIKYVENEYLDYQEESMLKKGIYIKPNGGEIAGLVLCWIGFVAFSICYVIAIFCGVEETGNGRYTCDERCPLHGFCNYIHYKENDEDDENDSSGSLWNSFWGIGKQFTPTIG